MVLGGTPLYLQMLERKQNVDNLFFAPNAPLSREYNFLFRSLFNEATLHKQIIEVLHQTFVTTYGLKKDMYSGDVQSETVLDDLFIE